MPRLSHYLNLIVILLCLFLLPCQSDAAHRTVRVGYYPVLHFQEYDSASHMYRGYSYEYLLALAASKDLQFIVRRHPIFDGYVKADSVRIQQIFVNLLNNAIKFTPAGGKVEFLCAEKATEDQVHYQIRVRDNGIGMTKEYLPRLFDAYSQENRNSSSRMVGTGLGLSIVKQLVELLQGEIKVESAVGKGTTFTINFSLPQLKDFQPPTAEELNKSAQDIWAGKRVLLCEDQAINAELIKAILGSWDLQLTWAKNGEEGLRIFNNALPGTFALILMDKQMPIMDGVTAVRKLRRLTHPDAAKIPVIALTGDADAASAKECLKNGMNAVLTKPLSRKDLYKLLKKFIAE